MFQIWKVATEAQFEWFTDSFQEEIQRRIPEAFEAALSWSFLHYVTSMKLDKTKASVQILKILTSKCIQKYCKKLFTEYRICLHTSLGMRNYTKNTMNRGCRPVNR